VATQWKLLTEDYVMGVAHIMNYAHKDYNGFKWTL